MGPGGAHEGGHSAIQGSSNDQVWHPHNMKGHTVCNKEACMQDVSAGNFARQSLLKFGVVATRGPAAPHRAGSYGERQGVTAVLVIFIISCNRNSVKFTCTRLNFNLMLSSYNFVRSLF